MAKSYVFDTAPVKALNQRMRIFGTQGGRTDVHLPFLPFKHMPVHLETDTFRLHYMQRLGCFALLPFFTVSSCGFLDKVRKKVLGRERRRNARTL